MATAAVPNDFQNNTTADAEQVDANFSAVTAFLNDQTIHKDGSKAMTGELPLVDGANAASKTYVDNRIPVVELSGSELVSGKTTFPYSGFASVSTQVVSFGTTFTSAPNVQVTVEAYAPTATNMRSIAYVVDVTTTQMTLGINMQANFSDSTPRQFTVHWTALGQVA